MRAVENLKGQTPLFANVSRRYRFPSVIFGLLRRSANTYQAPDMSAGGIEITTPA